MASVRVATGRRGPQNADMSMAEPAPVPRPRAPRLISPARAEATAPPPFDGVWAPADTRLDDIALLRLPTGAAPEDVAVDAEGRLVAGGDDGTVWRWPAVAGSAGSDVVPERIAATGGRPLG